MGVSPQKQRGRLLSVLEAFGALALTPLLVFISTTNSLFIRNAGDFINDVHVLDGFVAAAVLTSALGFLLYFPSLLTSRRLWRLPVWLYLLAGPFFLGYAFLHVRLPEAMNTVAACAAFVLALLVLAALLTRAFELRSGLWVASRFFVVFLAVEAFIFVSNPQSRHSVFATEEDVAQVQPSDVRRPNIYHVVLDAYQSDLFECTLTPEIRHSLGGYQFFRENITVYGATGMAIPSVFQGRPFDIDSSQKAYMYEAYNSEKSFLHPLLANGYETYGFLSINLAEGGMRQLIHKRRHDEYADARFTLDIGAEFRALWLYAHFPSFVVSKLVPEDKIEGIKGGRLLPTAQPIYSFASLQRFLREEESLADHNRYTFIHLMLPHPPLVLRPDGSFGSPQADGTLPKTSLLEQAQCTTSLIIQFTDMLKKLGRFDNSLIVFHGDHGTWGLPPEIKEEGPRSADYTTEDHAWAVSRALLLLKLPGRDASAPLEVRDEETELLDLAPTILAATGLPADSLHTGVALTHPENVPENRERLFHSYPRGDFARGQLTKEFVQFSIRGNTYAKVGSVELKNNTSGVVAEEADRYFGADAQPSSIANGGFEDYPDGAELPDGWRTALRPPKCEREETLIKFGKYSAALTALPIEGSPYTERMFVPTTAPPVEQLRGKEVTFGMWVYTPQPDKVKIRIVDSWKARWDAEILRANEWQLVTRRATIRDDAEKVLFSVMLSVANEGDAQTVCYVDNAALIIHE